jgi:DNA-directed RNA polymerase specialized sigma24 family protein
MSTPMKARESSQGVELVCDEFVVAQLAPDEAFELALELLRKLPEARSTDAYRSIEWVSAKEVSALLGIPLRTAQRHVTRYATAHTRTPGGGTLVARAEVEARASKALGVDRRRSK